MSKIGKAGIEGDEHTSERVGRKLVDHPRTDVENPSRRDVLHQRSSEDYPWLQWKDDEIVKKEYH